MNLSWKITMAFVRRRRWLHAKAPVCPICATTQVQLIDAHGYPAEWKCRSCKTVFQFEPGPADVPIVNSTIIPTQ